MLTFIRYIKVYFTFAFLAFVRYNKDLVKSRFCAIHFNVILAGLKKIVRYNAPKASLYHCCQLSRIIRETPDFGPYLPVSRLESKISRIIGGSQWGGGIYGYRLKFWLFYGYRLIFFSYG